MMLLERPRLIYQIRSTYRVIQCLGNRAELFVLIQFRSNQCHIMRRCIMVFVMQPIGIHPVGTCTSKLATSVIHRLDKRIIITAHLLSDILCHRIRDFIGRCKQNCI